MRSIAHVLLFVHWPVWVTWTAVGAAITALIGFSEKILSLIKQWRELRDREHLVQKKVQAIEALEFEERQQRGQSTYRLSSVLVDEGEDPAIVAEAWRRFLQKRKEEEDRKIRGRY